MSLLQGCAEGYRKTGTKVPTSEEDPCRWRISRLSWELGDGKIRLGHGGRAQA